MKIGITTDIHFRGITPRSRIDDFQLTALTKFKEALSIFAKEGCDIILDAGDMLHSPIISLTLCDEILDILDKYQITVYTLFGNHPMLNGHIENSKATTLAHMLKRSKYLKYLDSIDLSDTFEELTIKGYDYYFGIEDNIKKGMLINPALNSQNFNIAVIHAMIVNKKFPDSVQHINYKDLKSNYNLVICGHYHEPLGIQKIGKFTIVGVGALTRGTCKDSDMQRIPQIGILNTKTREINLIPLKSAQPYDNVFDINKIETLKKNENEIDDFVNSLNDIGLSSLDVAGIILEIIKGREDEELIKTSLLNRIAKLKGDSNVS